MPPLADVRVLDFTTLLPGPFATLVLAEAGAEVIKVERPGGEEMRGGRPRAGDHGLLFAMLNRGKKSIEIDLKAPGAAARLRPLVESADVPRRAVPPRRHGAPRPRLGRRARNEPAARLLFDHGLRTGRAARRRRGPTT